MPFSDLAVLGILPIAIWASVGYVVCSSSKFATTLRSTWGAETKNELIEGSHSWAVLVVGAFFVIFAAVALRVQVHGWNARQMLFDPASWERGVFHGIFLGLTLMGLAIICRRHFPEAKKFSLVVMAGISSPFIVRVSILLIVVFTEELWRVVCLKALIGDGLSGLQALIATSTAYGLTYLAWGAPVAISETIVGAVYGALFLWSGSFLVPFAAHAILLGQILLYVAIAAPNTGPGDFHRRAYTECPACRTSLRLEQVNLNPNEAFFCPSCYARVTISDSRRGFLRWGFVFVTTGLMVASWDILPGATVGGNTTQFVLSMAMTICAGTSVWLLLQVIFPPRLECGDADVIELHLQNRRAGEPISEKTSETREPDSTRR
jgi:hypothetical protein